MALLENLQHVSFSVPQTHFDLILRFFEPSSIGLFGVSFAESLIKCSTEVRRRAPCPARSRRPWGRPSAPRGRPRASASPLAARASSATAAGPDHESRIAIPPPFLTVRRSMILTELRYFRTILSSNCISFSMRKRS